MLEHPVQAQLMCPRPVPGYVPSASAYEPAVQMLAATHANVTQLRDRGLFRPDVDVELLLRTWTVLTTADRIYRFSTCIPEIGPGGCTFNQCLVDTEEPLLYHTGMRQQFPLVRAAVEKVLPVERLRWVAFAHVEADECAVLTAAPAFGGRPGALRRGPGGVAALPVRRRTDAARAVLAFLMGRAD